MHDIIKINLFVPQIWKVSWIRRRDSHILSVDRTMFIPDERFQALFVDASDTWTLQVKYVQARDEGEYECQISTDPKKSHIIKLNIVGEIAWTFFDNNNNIFQY